MNKCRKTVKLYPMQRTENTSNRTENEGKKDYMYPYHRYYKSEKVQRNKM